MPAGGSVHRDGRFQAAGPPAGSVMDMPMSVAQPPGYPCAAYGWW
jgi:hypothetical protein